MRRDKNGKTALIILTVLIALIYAGCTNGKYEKVDLENPDLSGETSSSLALLNGNAHYSVDKIVNTFLLETQIYPSDASEAHSIRITGKLDEDAYWLLADQLEIIHVVSGQTVGQFALVNDNEPIFFTTITLVESEKTVWGELILADVNFDGYQDFGICADSGAMNSRYLYWIWNDETGNYEPEEALNGLSIFNPTFLDNERKILSWFPDGIMMCTEYIYEYRDGTPMLVEETLYEFYLEDDYTRKMTSRLIDGTMQFVAEEYYKPNNLEK